MISLSVVLCAGLQTADEGTPQINQVRKQEDVDVMILSRTYLKCNMSHTIGGKADVASYHCVAGRKGRLAPSLVLLTTCQFHCRGSRLLWRRSGRKFVRYWTRGLLTPPLATEQRNELARNSKYERTPLITITACRCVSLMQVCHELCQGHDMLMFFWVTK